MEDSELFGRYEKEDCKKEIKYMTGPTSSPFTHLNNYNPIQEEKPRKN